MNIDGYETTGTSPPFRPDHYEQMVGELADYRAMEGSRYRRAGERRAVRDSIVDAAARQLGLNALTDDQRDELEEEINRGRISVVVTL